MFLQKLISNYHQSLALPFNQVNLATDNKYYGPFVFDDHAKAIDCISPIHNYPFGKSFPLNSQNLRGTSLDNIVDKINLVLSQFFGESVYLKNTLSIIDNNVQFIEFNQIISRQMTKENCLHIKTPFGALFEISRTKCDSENILTPELCTLYSQLRFLCNKHYEFILQQYLSFIDEFKKITQEYQNISEDNQIFKSSINLTPLLQKHGIVIQQINNECQWKFPMCLKSQEEVFIINTFKNLLEKINEGTCLY